MWPAAIGGGMDRRDFFRTGALLAAGSLTVTEPAVAHESAHAIAPVVSWEWVGGFLLPGFAALRPARLVAYRDGQTVADAVRTLMLGDRELQALRRHMSTVLRDPANTHRRPGAPIIADAPETRFTVKASSGARYTAQVDALQGSPTHDAYPPALYQLLDQLTRLHHRVLARGAAYRPNAVRLLAVADTAHPPATTAGWPVRIPLPPIRANALYGRRDLRGATAREVVRTIPHNDLLPWPLYRTTDGHAVRAAWRYLLPHE
jgi:hypothetical protein